jgi:hypothetical protein
VINNERLGAEWRNDEKVFFFDSIEMKITFKINGINIAIVRSKVFEPNSKIEVLMMW